MINYNYCKDSYYDVIDDIYEKINNIVKKVELKDSRINYGYIGLTENVIALECNDSLNNNYLPGVSTKEFKEFIEKENQMCDYFRKYIVSIIDENGQIINVERNRIIKHILPGGEVEYLYDGKVIQEKGISPYLLHEGLKNALMIEIEKAYRRKRK